MLGRLYFSAALVATFLLFLIATLRFRSFHDSLFPLLAIIPALILLIYEMVREFAAYRSRQDTSGKTTAALNGKYLEVAFWVGLSLGMYWLIGFLLTAVLFPFVYLRYYREGWALSIGLPVGSGIFFYTVFSWILEISFYQGVLLEAFFD